MSHSEVINVAVVGLGIGRAHIADGYKPNADRFKVLAVCDVDAARMAPIAAEFGIERQLTDFDAMLAMDDIHLVDICTPPNLHYPMILKALAAGKHVICEKPLVGSLQEADAVISAEKRAKGLLMPVFQYRFGDGAEQAKAIIDSGIAGKPYLATVETHWTRGPSYYAVPWRGKWASELGGVLMTHAIHQHDLFNYLMGDISRLFGRVTTRVNDIEVEDCVSASVEFANGALGAMTATLGSVKEISRIRLLFENLTLENDSSPYAPGGAPWTILPRTEETAQQVDAILKDWQSVHPLYQTQFARFHDAIHGRGPMPVTTADSRRALELVTAFYRSARTGEDVQMPISRDHPSYTSWVPPQFRVASVGPAA